MLGLLGHSNQLIDEARKRLASKQRHRKSALKKNGALQIGLHYNTLQRRGQQNPPSTDREKKVNKKNN